MSFSIKGTEGAIEKGKYDKFTVNSKNNTFELSGEDASAKELTYKHSDGVITVDISGTEHEYYKEGTDADEETLKKYNDNKSLNSGISSPRIQAFLIVRVASL